VGRDEKRVAELAQRGLQVVQGTPTAPEVLHAAGADTVAALMALSSSDEENLAVCCVSQEQFGIPNIIALASNPAVAMQMSDCGLRVIQPQLATVLALEGAWYFPETFNMLANSHGVAIREALLSNPWLHGRPLRRINLPGEVLVLGLRRRHEALIPHGDTVLHRGDVLMLIGDPEGLEQALVSINPSHRGGEIWSSQETLPSMGI
jgi:Trk K+ transport system NAD-binding subunit